MKHDLKCVKTNPDNITSPSAATPNKLSGAIALSYHGGMAAPRVTAKGRGHIAEEIVRRAREAGIYIHESAELIALLMQVDLDEHIPPELYVTVAELLAWLYRLENDAENTISPTQ